MARPKKPRVFSRLVGRNRALFARKIIETHLQDISDTLGFGKIYKDLKNLASSTQLNSQDSKGSLEKYQLNYNKPTLDDYEDIIEERNKMSQIKECTKWALDCIDKNKKRFKQKSNECSSDNGILDKEVRRKISMLEHLKDETDKAWDTLFSEESSEEGEDFETKLGIKKEIEENQRMKCRINRAATSDFTQYTGFSLSSSKSLNYSPERLEEMIKNNPFDKVDHHDKMKWNLSTTIKEEKNEGSEDDVLKKLVESKNVKESETLIKTWGVFGAKNHENDDINKRKGLESKHSLSDSFMNSLSKVQKEKPLSNSSIVEELDIAEEKRFEKTPNINNHSVFNPFNTYTFYDDGGKDLSVTESQTKHKPHTELPVEDLNKEKQSEFIKSSSESFIFEYDNLTSVDVYGPKQDYSFKKDK